MNPGLRNFLIFAAAAAAATFAGLKIADENYLWPALFAVVALVAILVRVFQMPLDVITLGLLVFGYILGNRGFAQLMPHPSFPLLPAEAVLLVAGFWVILACAAERRLPWRNDLLNWSVFAWLVAGTSRVIFDIRPHGLNAIRDYAAVYYGLFFFMAQRAAARESHRTFLLGMTLAAIVALPVFNALFETAPDFFYSHMQVYGVPLIVYKGDLVYMFFAVGSVLLFHWAHGRRRYWAWPCSVILFLLVMAEESRASILGLCISMVMLAVARQWRFPVLQLTVSALAFAAVLAVATLTTNSWADTQVDQVVSRIESVVNPTRLVREGTDTGAYKWDNNRFRLVWWHTVVEETLAGNPAFGLGFGYDLARNFLQEYNPDMAEEFTARSPHNVAMTAFGRMGFVGLAAWLLVCCAVVRSAWLAVRDARIPVATGLWCGLVIILIAAHFGVVLEGPMGAVPFWILLGLARQVSAADTASASQNAQEDDPARAAATPRPEPASTS